MHYTEVIKSPILTEKTNIMSSTNNEYVFKVDVRTNKVEVRKAIEFIYKVKVVSVNMIRVEKQPTSLGRSKGFTTRYKKAIVKLAPNDIINFMPQQTAPEAKVEEAQIVEDTKAKKETSDKLKAVEAKIAAKKAASSKTVETATKKPVTSKSNLTVKKTTSKSKTTATKAKKAEK